MDYKVLHFKVTPEIHRAIKARAAEAGLTMNAFLVELIELGANNSRRLQAARRSETNQEKSDSQNSVALRKKDLRGNYEPMVEAGKSIPKCCTLAKRCQHWSWNGENDSWVNSITGEVRETA